MKKTDIAMIILVASISVAIAYFVVRAIPGLNNVNQPVKVPTIEEYSADVGEVDSTVFSKDALNPTVRVTIGNDGAPASDN